MSNWRIILLPLFIFAFCSFIFYGYTCYVNEPLIMIFAIPFSLTIAVSFYLLSSNKKDHKVLRIIISNRSSLLLILTMVAILLCIIFPSFNYSVIWSEIPFQNWIRLIAWIFLTSFLPGYLILKIFDKKSSITGLASVLFSNLLSIFAMFIIVFIMLFFSASLSNAIIIVMVLDVFLASLYFALSHLKKIEPSQNTVINSYHILLVLTFLIAVIGSVVVMLFCMPLTRSDMWIIQSEGLEFSKGFPTFYSSYPYLYQLYLSILFVGSGITSSLTMQALYCSSIIPLLGFYSVIKQWFENQNSTKISAIASFLSIFLGFGSLFLLYLQSSIPQGTFRSLSSLMANQTYDLYMRFPIIPYMIVLRWVVGLPILFALLYLLKKDQCPIRSILFATVVAMGYLAYAANVILFIPILFVWVLFFRTDFRWKVGLSFIAGLLVVPIIDFLAPQQLYVVSMSNTTGQYVLSSSYEVTLILVIILTLVETARSKWSFLSKLVNRVYSVSLVFLRYARWPLVYFYFFSFALWLTIGKNYDLSLFGGYNVVPFFIFPVRWGAIGLIALLTLAFYFKNIVTSKSLSFFLVILIVGLIFEQASSYYSIFYAERQAAIISIGLSVIAAYGIINFFTKSYKRPISKKVMSILLMLLILPGAITTAVYYSDMTYLNGHGAEGTNITNDEFQAIDYIRQNLAKNESILTFTYRSSFKIGTFAGISTQCLYPYGTSDQSNNLVSYGFLKSQNPFSIIYLLAKTNTRFIYVGSDDVALLSSKNYVINSIMAYLPVVKSYPNITVYEVPKLTANNLDLSSSLSVIDLPIANDSISFDGLRSYVSLNSTKSCPSAITIEFKFFKNAGEFNYKFIVDKPKKSWVSYAVLGTNKDQLKFVVGIDGNTTTRQITTNTIFNDNQWYDVACTYNGTYIAIYVNNNLDKESVFDSYEGIYYDSIQTTATLPSLGQHSFESNSYFNGSINYIRLYNRSLSADELTGDYMNDYPQNPKDLICWLDSSTYLVDRSDNCKIFSDFIDLESSKISSGSNSFVPLFMSMLDLDYSVIQFNDYMTSLLDTYLSSYNSVVLTTDPILESIELMNWLASGNRTLLVFNTAGRGYFANKLSIPAIPAFVTIYSLFSSKILYVNVCPYLKANDLDFLKTDNISTTFSSLIKTNSIERFGQQLPGNTFNITYGSFITVGNLTVSTDFITIKNPTINSLKGTFFPSSISISGKLILEITNASINVSPTDGYLTLATNQSMLKCNVKGELDSKLYSDTGSLDQLLNEGSLDFFASELLVRLPKLNASGTTIFDKLYTHIVPYVPLDGIVLQKTEIDGSIKFNVVSSEQSLIIFSYFDTEGDVINLEQSSSSQIFPIPWSRVIASPYILLLNLCTAIVLALYITKQLLHKRNKKIVVTFNRKQKK